jgi:hypothetical protein
MSKRLQVLLPDDELAAIQSIARREHVPVGEWVRRTLREARERQPVKDPETKLRAIREAMKYSFPTADIEKMNEEIERGYLSDLP